MTDTPRAYERLRETAAATLSLFEQLAALTSQALDAVERGEGEALDTILGRREEVISRATPLLQLLARAGQAAGPDGPAAKLLSRVTAAARHLQAGDAHLTARLAERRDAIATELEDLEAAAAARLAYGSTPRTKTLDLLR